jgi:hypothetical protein
MQMLVGLKSRLAPSPSLSPSPSPSTRPLFRLASLHPRRKQYKPCLSEKASYPQILCHGGGGGHICAQPGEYVPRLDVFGDD